MATPRSASADAAGVTASKMDTTQPASSSSADGGDYERVYKSTRKEKVKVDWKDVEAKAKREAMWLLEWRKQQAAQADAINGRRPPKKRRRKSSGSVTNDAPTIPCNAVATDACQGKPGKDAASERPPAETFETLPTSPRNPEAERVAVVTPPESWLTSPGPVTAAVAEAAVSGVGGKASSGAPAFEQHSEGLSSTEMLVDSPSLDEEVAPAASVGAVGLGSASKVFPPQSPQAAALSIMTTAAASPESSSALPLEGDDEELLDMESETSELPMENVGASVPGRCLPIPTEDDSLWPRLPMPEPGPEVEAAWAPVCGTETSTLGPNWWHYCCSSGDVDVGDVGADSGWGVSAIKPPKTMFSFPPFPPPFPTPPLLPGNTTVDVEMPSARREQGKEQPTPTLERKEERVSLEAAADPCESTSRGEDNGISLLAAAAVGRVLENDPQELGESAPLRSARPRMAMRDADSVACVSTSVGGNQANEEHRSSAGQAGSSASPLEVAAECQPQRREADTDVGVAARGKSRLPWRPRELRFLVRGRPRAHAGPARGEEDGGVTPPVASRQGVNRMPRPTECSSAQRARGCSTTFEMQASLLDDPAECGRRMSGPDVCRASHGRVQCPAVECEGLGLCPDALSATALSSLENGAVAKDRRSMSGLESLLCLPTAALEALQAVGLWSETDAAKAAASAETEADADAFDSPARWGGFGVSVPGGDLAARQAALALAVEGGGPVMWGYDGYYDGGMERKRKTSRKKRPRRKRETHILVSESEGEEEPSTSTSMWAGLEEKAKAEAKALLSYRNSGMVEAEADDNQHWVRRSVRAAGASALEYPHVAKLLEQIRSNDPEVEVLKLHHYLGPDVNSTVINAVLDALSTNNNCQALYIQNFTEGFQDEQVAALSKVLQRGNIWCLNAGENYKVSLDTWWQFVEDIKSTNVTHAYLSEHVITPELKIAMRNAIRDNRRNHTRHKMASNMEVIRRCTNMWWNPINSKDLQAELKAMDAASLGGIGAELVAPVAERVPCSLHGKPGKPPDSPDRTDCPLRPRGACVFLDGVIH